MTRLALVAVLALAACATRPTPPPVVRTVEVRVPVSVPCRPDIGPEPEYADSREALAAAPDVLEAMKLRIVGRTQRIARDAVKTAALAGCALSPAPS